MHQSKEQKLKLTIVILSVLLAISLTALLFVSSMLHHPHTTSTTPNNIIAAGQTASTYITTAAKPLSASREIHATTLSSRKTSNSQSETLKLNRTHTTDNVPFNVSNMFPGDQTTNEFCVRVSYNEPATLHFLATVQPGYEKLAEVMKLRISVDGQTEYDGLLRNAWITTSVEPGLL